MASFFFLYKNVSSASPVSAVSKADQEGGMIYKRDKKGRFILGVDGEGKEWHPEYPVCMISWNSAMAYCRWLAHKTNLSWRLPFELEWEKAARGVDGRFHVWGDKFQNPWSLSRSGVLTVGGPIFESFGCQSDRQP